MPFFKKNKKEEETQTENIQIGKKPIEETKETEKQYTLAELIAINPESWYKGETWRIYVEQRDLLIEIRDILKKIENESNK